MEIRYEERDGKIFKIMTSELDLSEPNAENYAYSVWKASQRPPERKRRARAYAEDLLLQPTV